MMVRIKCVNQKCTSPTKSFEWDEAKHVQGRSIAQPFEHGAVRMIALCPFCLTENVVWIKNADQKDEITRKL